MKFFFTFCFAIFLINITSQAQKSYIAIYKQHVSDPGLNDGSSNYFLKYLVDNSTITCICNPNYNVKTLLPAIEDDKIHKTDNFNDVKIHNTGDGTNTSAIIYLQNEYRCSKIVNKKEKVFCYPIDIAGLKFIKTSKTKKIKSWLCNQYLSKDKKNADIIVWATTQLPWYVNPGFYLQDKTHGIVSIEFKKKGSITLENIKDNENNKPKIDLVGKCQKIDSLFDPLKFQIRQL